METNNAAELLFFTNKQQVYKARVSDFPEGKASLLGEYVASLLGFDEGENPVYMVVTEDYSGDMVFVFDNGRVAKIPLSAYSTKTNRKKLINAYCEKFTLHTILHVGEAAEILLTSTNGRMLLVNTAAVSGKTTRNSGGIMVMTQKRGQRIFTATVYEKGSMENEHRYRTRNLPAAGSYKPSNTAEQAKMEL